ncbi:hypothetical protein ACHHYP_16885 [Achlya hypogyna]|uniref:FAM194 C-terminal domain-containing protein n=1 Tax=Achlya hypogyna TaxID=1202772 RepID=A0A1V9Y5J4_ACHHY|nr:hypothetical protein ACHHYP_16885 [Achlya hypogyna]
MGALCQKEAATTVAAPSPRTLHVILVYSNPQNFASRKRLLLQTHRHLLDVKQRLTGNDSLEVVVAQVAYDGADYVQLDETGKYDLCLRTPSVNAIWCKENLVNLAVRNILQRTSHCAEYFAYVDADITFESPLFVTDTLDRLHPHAMLQMFETATLENPIPTVVKGFGYQYHMNNKLASALKNVSNDHSDYWHPGFAWALHRDVFLAAGGLIERSYGSGDRHMAMAIIGRAQDSIPNNANVAPAYAQMILDWQAVAMEYGVQLGYVPGSVFHSWHGSLVNRQYMGRWDTIVKHQFDPYEHLHVSPDTGLLEWSTAASKELRAEVAAYFSNRNEDEPMPTVHQQAKKSARHRLRVRTDKPMATTTITITTITTATTTEIRNMVNQTPKMTPGSMMNNSEEALDALGGQSGSLRLLPPEVVVAKEQAAKKDDKRDVNLAYPTGEQAVVFDADGCGFCYYETGRVAVCVSKVNAYQRRHTFYDNSRLKRILCSIDEHVVGSADKPHGCKLVLTKDGAIYSDGNNDIVHVLELVNAGTPPKDPILIQLNENLSFKFVDRKQIVVKFVNCGIALDFQCGERLKREDTYLGHSHRITIGPQRGKLLIDTTCPNLVQRQKQIEVAALEKRSKQHPRSQDLSHPSIKQVVTGLEQTFDRYEGCKVTPYCSGSWLSDARERTLAELPVLPPTGFEVGTEPTIFGQPMQPHETKHLLHNLQNKDGQWLASLEIRQNLEHANPVLPRTAVLCNASGRYSVDIQVPGGSAVAKGARLDLVTSASLDDFLSTECGTDQLVLVACLRADDRRSRHAEKALEAVNEILSEKPDALMQHAFPQSLVVNIINHKYRIVKVDLAESRALAKRYRIHATPTFLLFFEGKLVGVSSLGGQALRITPTTKNASLTHLMDQPPRTLLVQANVKLQVANEKILRKEHFDWDLAMNGEQAMLRFTKMAKAASVNGVVPSYDLIILSDDVNESDCRMIDRYLRSGDSKKGKLNSDVLVCSLLTDPLIEIQFSTMICDACRVAHGRRTSVAAELFGVCPHCGIVPKKLATEFLPAAVVSMTHVVVYKHIRATTLHRLAELWRERSLKRKSEQLHRGPEVEAHLGFTKEAFFREMDVALQNGRQGHFLPKSHIPEMALSATETFVGATHLTKPPHSA